MNAVHKTEPAREQHSVCCVTDGTQWFGIFWTISMMASDR